MAKVCKTTNRLKHLYFVLVLELVSRVSLIVWLLGTCEASRPGLARERKWADCIVAEDAPQAYLPTRTNPKASNAAWSATHLYVTPYLVVVPTHRFPPGSTIL